MQILSIITLIGEPLYVATASKARIATAQSNVNSAITPAQSYYADTAIDPTPYTYGSITGAKLRLEAPGVSATLKAGSKTVSSTNDAFCIQDTGDGGATFYRYKAETEARPPLFRARARRRTTSPDLQAEDGAATPRRTLGDEGSRESSDPGADALDRDSPHLLGLRLRIVAQSRVGGSEHCRTQINGVKSGP